MHILCAGKVRIFPYANTCFPNLSLNFHYLYSPVWQHRSAMFFLQAFCSHRLCGKARAMEHTENRLQSAYGKVFAICVFPSLFFVLFSECIWIRIHIKFRPTTKHTYSTRPPTPVEYIPCIYIEKYSNATEKTIPKVKIIIICAMFALCFVVLLCMHYYMGKRMNIGAHRN